MIDEEHRPTKGPNWKIAAGVAVAVAVIVTLIACWTQGNQGVLSRIFGPPSVVMSESYNQSEDGIAFDHSGFSELLAHHVLDGGWVDYEGFAADHEQLQSHIESLAAAPIDDMGRDERLALLINAYNAFTIKLILDHWPVDSIRDIPAAERWDAQRWNIGGNVWSLNQIEHEQIRPHFAEPRVHFALVCAAVGCPPLRREAYQADRLDQQLDDQAQYVHTHPRWFRFDGASHTVHLTSLYDWYGSDFVQFSGSVLDFAALHSPALQSAMETDRDLRIEYLDYDWSLNSVENRSLVAGP